MLTFYLISVVLAIISFLHSGFDLVEEENPPYEVKVICITIIILCPVLNFIFFLATILTKK